MATPSSRELHCVVVTPERALLDTSADFVAVPMYDGEMGILPGRAPVIGRLGYGELRIRKGSKTVHLYVDGGFLQVRGNTVTLLTSRAMKASEIKPEVIQQTLENAKAGLKEAKGPEAQATQLRAQEKARAQLRVASHRTSDEMLA